MASFVPISCFNINPPSSSSSSSSCVHKTLKDKITIVDGNALPYGRAAVSLLGGKSIENTKSKKGIYFIVKYINNYNNNNNNNNY